MRPVVTRRLPEIARAVLDGTPIEDVARRHGCRTGSIVRAAYASGNRPLGRSLAAAARDAARRLPGQITTDQEGEGTR